MSVQEFGQNIEEAQRKLEEIITLLSTGQGHAVRCHEQSGERIGSVRQTSDALRERLDHLTQAATEHQNTVAEMRSSVEQITAELMRGLHEAGQHADWGFQEVQTACESVRDGLQALTTTIETATTSACDVFESAQQACTNHQSQVDERQTTLHETIAAVVSLCESSTQEIADTKENALATFERIVAGFSEHKNSVDDGMNTFTGDFKSDVGEQFCNSMSEMGSDFSEFSQDLNGEVESLGQQFGDRIDAMLENLSQYAHDQFENEVEQAVEHLIRETIATFAAEMVQSIVVTQTGVSTTSALSPILPELVAAKMVTGTINRVLSVGGIF